MRCRAAVLVTISVVACSSGTRGVPPGGPGSATPSDAAPVASAMPTEQECADLIAHVVALGVADQRAAKPADQVVTEDEQAKIRNALQAELAAGCRSLTREVYRCAMATRSTAELVKC